MGLEFKIDTEAGIVYTVGRGDISFDEFIENRRKVNSHPDFSKEFFGLADYREVTMARNTDQARAVAQGLIFAKAAVVAGEKSYAFCRMIQGWADAAEEGVFSVFRDMASAREWLGLPPEEE